MSNSYILGLNTGHNATACLLKNGKVIDCVSEERFTGIKNQSGFPRKSIKYIFARNKIKNKDIDLVTTCYLYKGLTPVSKEDSNIHDKFYKFIYFSAGINVRKILRNLEKNNDFLKRINWFFYSWIIKYLGSKRAKLEKEQIVEQLKIPRTKIHFFDHHSTHAFAAYYTSPFNKKNAVILTLDGEGDLLCASVWMATEGKLKKISETPSYASLGWLYMEITRYLGMKPNEHEYKVMGLAPYAKGEAVEKLYRKICNIITFSQQDKLRFESIVDVHGVYSYLKKILEGERFDNIAAAFQKLVEERVSEWVKECIGKTGARTLILSGGVFMNVKVNQKISEIIDVEELFIMPSVGDKSAAIGAALMGYIEDCKENNKKMDCQQMIIKDLYWGPEYKNEEINKFLKNSGCYNKYKIEKYQDIEKKTAQLLAKGKIVARLSGRMEWGARALGNRSILANPQNQDTVLVINEKIKNRDFWMPFTPSILEERMNDYVLNPRKRNAPYMVLAFNSTELAKKQLSAAIHPYDHTLRPQAVYKAWNPNYYKLIKEFEKLTGIGAVLNTSFNLHGVPMVMGPKEAIHAFEHSGLNYLTIGNYLVSK